MNVSGVYFEGKLRPLVDVFPLKIHRVLCVCNYLILLYSLHTYFLSMGQ